VVLQEFITMKFIDVKTDFAFKKVFGSEGSKDILISFLNSLVLFSEGELIEDIAIVDPYQIPLIKGMKDTYVDVKAKLSNGVTVIIEMQVLNVQGMEQRILYNAAKAYSTQLVQGERYHLLNPVIAITITDFTMFTEISEFKSCFRLTEKNHLIEYNGDIELIFIELPKFNKSVEQLGDIIDKWIFFIKNAGSLEYIPETLSMVPELSHAFAIANEAGMSLEEQEAQWKRKDFIMLQKGALELAEKTGMERGMVCGMERGMEQGIERGMERGMERGRVEVARTLVTKGMSVEEAAEIAGISVEALETT
jgi:predicted transposase/invertase (TIGR01784 family)